MQQPVGSLGSWAKALNPRRWFQSVLEQSCHFVGLGLEEAGVVAGKPGLAELWQWDGENTPTMCFVVFFILPVPATAWHAEL